MTDILSAIDEAGRALLKRCEAVGEDGKPAVTVGQHTEAFLSMIKWYEVRSKLAPSPQPSEAVKSDSKFNDIREQFHGKPKRNPGNPWGRRGRPIEQPVEPPPSGDGDASQVGAAVLPINGTNAAPEAGSLDGMAPASPVEH